jgi:D-amino-acid dehydrogenase
MLRRCNPRDFDRGMRATARLNEATFTLFDLLESEGVRFEQHRDGLLMAFRSEHALAEHAAEAARLAELGLGEHAVVSGRQVRELEPALTSSVVGGIRWPGERFVDPDTFVDGLAAACRANGVQIRCDRAELGADRLARIDGERVAADAIVVCAGVWTPNVLAGAGIRLPVQAGKGYGVDHRPGPLPLSRALYLPEEKVAVTPLNAGIRAAGVMEFTGVDESLDRRRAEGVSAAVGRYLRGWPDRAGAATWAGLRPMTPDGLPVIGPLPGGDALHVATGHAMLGITLAPVTGRLLADTITRGAVPTEALPFLPARFLR